MALNTGARPSQYDAEFGPPQKRQEHRPVTEPDELFAQLKEFSWRGIAFPATTFETVLRHDLAEHKYPDRDGADVEATGLAPIEITARVPFRNGVIPARSESFGRLYPDTWRRFIAAMADKSTGTLQHPELGPLRCKPHSVRTVWAAEPRDGVDVDCSWIETIDPQQKVAMPSPIQTAMRGALDLDASLGTVASLPQTPTYEPNFADMMRGIQAIGDSVTLLSHRGAGVIASVEYRAQAVIDSVDRADKAGDVTLWALRQAAERVKSGVRGLRDTLLQSKRRIGLYPVPKPMTLAGVAAALSVDVTDLIDLNPGLLRLPIVAQGAIVRFYAR